MSRLLLIDRAEVPDVDAVVSQREALARASDLLGIELLAARQGRGFGEPFGRLELWAHNNLGDITRIAMHAGRVLDRHFDRAVAIALSRAPRTAWRPPDRHELLGELLRAACSEPDLHERRRVATSASLTRRPAQPRRLSSSRPPAQSPWTAARGGRELATAPDHGRDAGAAA